MVMILLSSTNSSVFTIQLIHVAVLSKVKNSQFRLFTIQAFLNVGKNFLKWRKCFIELMKLFYNP